MLFSESDFATGHDKISRHTVVGVERCRVLWKIAKQAAALSHGEFWECGVYRGGTAHLLADVAHSVMTPPKFLRLFDTWAGMPAPDPARDVHKIGDFGDASLNDVKALLDPYAPYVIYHPGVIPDTFVGTSASKIALAHIDVDIYQSVLDCCTWIYPGLVHGGFMVFDDYGFSTTPGCREAVDEYFRDRAEMPFVLDTGQAIIFKS